MVSNEFNCYGGQGIALDSAQTRGRQALEALQKHIHGKRFDFSQISFSPSDDGNNIEVTFTDSDQRNLYFEAVYNSQNAPPPVEDTNIYDDSLEEEEIEADMAVEPTSPPLGVSVPTVAI